MSTTSYVIETPAGSEPAQITLTASINAAGELRLLYGAADFADHGDTLKIECDQLQPVMIRVPDFEHDGVSWSVSATPRTRASRLVAWAHDGAAALDDGSGHMSNQVTVTVTAATATATKTRPLHVKTKPRHSLPAPQT